MNEKEQQIEERKSRTYQDLVMPVDPLLEEKKKTTPVERLETFPSKTSESSTEPKKKSILGKMGAGIQQLVGKGKDLMGKNESTSTLAAGNDIEQKAKAVGSLKVLEGVEKVAAQKIEDAKSMQLQQEVQKLEKGADEEERRQLANEAIQLANAQKQGQQNAYQMQQERLKKVQEERRKKAQEQQRQQAAEAGKQSLLKEAAKTAVKKQINPVSTSKILNAGAPGLGIIPWYLGKILGFKK